MGFLKKVTMPSRPIPISQMSSSSSSSASPSTSPSRERLTEQSNVSTSNLSTTSTLIDAPCIYERQSNIDAGRQKAQRSQAWPQDPWRGGFGPKAEVNGQEVCIGGRWMSAKEERREARREVGEWLRGNGLRKR